MWAGSRSHPLIALCRINDGVSKPFLKSKAKCFCGLLITSRNKRFYPCGLQVALI